MVRIHFKDINMNINIKRLMMIISTALLSIAAPSAFATLNVLSCEPEWAALVTEIGGNKVSVSSATTAFQDPHRIEARPSLIAKARNADLLVCTGLELESGWLPILLQQSGNPKIAAGQPGNFEAGQYVTRLEIPARLDRSDGDVHAAGNPHIQQDPHNIERVATALVARLRQVDTINAAYYQSRYQDFISRWHIAIGQWQQETARLKGVAVIEHHKNMAYLLHWLGMKSVGTLEPKPGVEPSAAHLNELLQQSKQLQQQSLKMILRAGYQDGRASEWLSEKAHLPIVVLPFTVGGNDKAQDLFGLFDDSIQRLLKGLWEGSK